MTNAIVPTKPPRRQGPAQVGNVIPLRPAKRTPAEIVASVRGRSVRQEAEILAKLQALNASMNVRHRERAEEAVPIGYAMTRPMLDDWLEIGEAMLAERGGHR